MYLLRRPADPVIRAFLASQASLPFSYERVGSTRTFDPATSVAPAGFVVDHNRIRLGEGAAAFGQAKAALHRWQMFDIGWARLCFPDAPLAAGTTVAVLARALGLWSLHATRIVYTLDEPGAGVSRYGFAYGTLPDHAASGEERFLVEWDHRKDEVWYDLLAVSRPAHLLTRLGYPYMRRLQRRFGPASLAAMQRAVAP